MLKLGHVLKWVLTFELTFVFFLQLEVLYPNFKLMLIIREVNYLS